MFIVADLVSLNVSFINHSTILDSLPAFQVINKKKSFDNQQVVLF